MASNHQQKQEAYEAAKIKVYQLTGPRGKVTIKMERLGSGAVVVSVSSSTTPVPEADFLDWMSAHKHVATVVSDLIEEGDV